MAKTPISLAGKVAAVTGGARGIGRATAAALIAQGVKVAIGDLDGPLAERAATELGAGTVGLTLDVTDRDSFAAFIEETERRLGRLDILVNNAGIMPIGPFVEESDATAHRMVDINLHGVIYGSKLALSRFLPRGSGHLVNVASIAGRGAAPNAATYAATKHAVYGLTDSLRQELRRTGVKLSVVMPVGVNTELYSGAKQLRGIKTPEPEDVANAIVEALQTERFEVFVPKLMNPLVRMTALLPRSVVQVVTALLGVDAVFATPDHTARAAYEARMAETIGEGDREEPFVPVP
jgi:NAD(P)-dependent dehydrogenase (short-subunit alcohol dehydrogenase family)